MLRNFPDGQSPSAIIRSAPWRTKVDKDYQLSTPRDEPIQSKAPPTAPRAERLPEPITEGSVLRNSAGQRIDWPVELNVDEQILNSLRKRRTRLCNLYYLRGDCPNRNCKYDHDSYLNEEEVEALLYLARCHPCNSGTSCDNPNCTSGHRCPNGKKCTYGNKCRFAGTHDMDLRPVQGTSAQAAPVQLISTRASPIQAVPVPEEYTPRWDENEYSQPEGVIW